MTYLESMKYKHPEMGEAEIIQMWCPSKFFGIQKEHCKNMGESLRAVPITKDLMSKCRACWEQEADVDTSHYPKAFMTKTTELYEKEYMQDIAEAMHNQPEGKKKLAARIAVDILESEQFLEAYPKTTDPERIKKRLTLVLTGNRVSAEDGKRILRELVEVYDGTRYHSERPSGASKSDSSHSSQPE